MVYTELAPRRQQFRVHQPCNEPNSTVSTPLRWIFKTHAERTQSLIANQMRHECSESAEELRVALNKRDYFTDYMDE